MRLTRRGWKVVIGLWFLLVIAFTWATSDVCWTGPGLLDYGSCTEMMNNYMEGK